MHSDENQPVYQQGNYMVYLSTRPFLQLAYMGEASTTRREFVPQQAVYPNQALDYGVTDDQKQVSVMLHEGID